MQQLNENPNNELGSSVKYYSLFLRVNHYNPAALSDMKMWYSLLAKVPVPISEYKLLEGAMIGSKEVLECLQYFASLMKSGDRLYFYITAHGDQQRAENDPGEIDRKDEIILLDNGDKLLDNDLFDYFCKFEEGTQIIFVVDACSSGTTYKLNKKNVHRETFFKKSETNNFDGLSAEIIYLGASLDGRLAQLDNSGSVFTKTLFQFVNTSSNLSFRDLFKKVYKKIKDNQEPVYTEISRRGVNLSFNFDDDKIAVPFRDQASFPRS